MKNNQKPLTELTILITRPQHQSKALNELILAAGGKTIVFPTIEIEVLTQQPKLQQLSKKINDYDIAIFVSANAVDHAIPLSLEEKSLTIIAIGPGTATALKKHNVTVDAVPTHYSSEGLLTLPQLANIQQKKIIIFCGENSRPFLRETLRQKGAQVDEAICYRRRRPQTDPQQLQWLMTQAIDHIVVTSLDSLENLFVLFQAYHTRLLQIPLLVISPAMAMQAAQLGFQHVNVALSAADDAVVQALIRQVE